MVNRGFVAWYNLLNSISLRGRDILATHCVFFSGCQCMSYPVDNYCQQYNADPCFEAFPYLDTVDGYLAGANRWLTIILSWL